jgi:hypothetical protein
LPVLTEQEDLRLARLIEITDPCRSPSPLALSVGDLLLFRACGGQVSVGQAIESLGPFLTADVGDDGAIYTPQGPPNLVVFRARRPGVATVTLVTGDPFHSPVTTEIQVEVGV